MKFPSASNITKLLLARSTTTTCSVCGLKTIPDGLKVLGIFLCGLINRVGWIVRDLKLVSLAARLETKNTVFEAVMSKLPLFVTQR